VLALCVASHHSGLIDYLDIEGTADTLPHRIEKATQKTHLYEMRDAADTEIITRVENYS
jgi:CRISPR-associated endonuclease/helicase Cas3